MITAVVITLAASAFLGTPAVGATKPPTNTPHSPAQATAKSDQMTKKAPDPGNVPPTEDKSPSWGLTAHPGGVSLGATKKAPTATSVVIIQPTNTLLPTNTPLPTATNTPIPANKLAKSFCDQLNDVGVTPTAPSYVPSLEMWARYGPWGFAWKDNQDGRSRTWPVACKWIADKSAKGGKWSQEPMDPSNSHINDSNPDNDFTAWLNKLRGSYEDYKKGWLRFP